MIRRNRLRWLAVLVAVVGGLLVACGDDAGTPATVSVSPSSAATAPADTSATLGPGLAGTTSSVPATSTTTFVARLVLLGEEFDLATGERIRIAGVEIDVELVDAHGPGEDCNDCPLRAELEVRSGSERQSVEFSFSPNMLSELLEQARRREAFGLVFVARRIDDGSVTLRVDPVIE